MTKRFVLGAVMTAVLAGSAAAADMPTKAAPYRNYQPGTYSWQGFYVGGTVGAGIVNPQLTDHDAFFTYGDWPAGEAAFTGGLTAGYNVQYGAAVFGIEADINWTSFDRTLTNPAFGSQFDAKWNWFSTVRGRFGLAFDRALVYATAGVAIVGQDLKAFYPGDQCGDVACAKAKKTEVGLALGAGAEYALGNNWSFKAEYLFIKLPSKEANDFAVNDSAAFQFTTDAHFARIGLNYRFGY